MKKIASVIRANRLLICIIIVAVGGFLLANAFVKQIKTDSMNPSMPRGTVVLDIPTDHVQKGDIITFRDDEGAVVTHRVYAVKSDGTIVTKGDANVTTDSIATPLRMRNVIGKVFLNRGVSWIVLVIGAVIAVVLITMIYMIFKVATTKDTSAQDDDEQEDTTTGELTLSESHPV